MARSDTSLETVLVVVGTVGALVSAAFESSFLVTACFAGIGIVSGLAILPWHEQIAGRGKEIQFFCCWVALWPLLLVYLAWEGLRMYVDHWGHYLARRQYERDAAKKR